MWSAEMVRIKKSGNKYLVESSSKKGKFYKVDVKKPFCSCPDFMFRELKIHGECKHLKAVRAYISKNILGCGKKSKRGKQRQGSRGRDLEKELLEELKKGPVDSIKLINKYGEGIVDELKRRGEIIEKGGEVRILK